ncbi:MAG: CHC2 zinc finger domain-containing protein [Lysobacter sp.]
MARIPEHEIEQLKAEVSLVRLVEARGIVLTKQGKDYAGRCPFHEDATPSLIVTPTKNLYHCFGCGAAGGPIDWVMKLDGVSFRHAVELLRHDLPHLAAASDAAEPKALKRSTVPKLASPLAADGDGQALLQQVVDYYHTTLQDSPEALAYLESRGLHHPELIATFQLGVANRSLAYRLPQKSRQAGAALRGQLQQLGVLRKSGHEHLNGSLVVPLCDAGGQVVQLYGRKINDNLRPGTSYHLYLPGPQCGVWNLDGIKGHREVILCEALIDAMTFWCAGFRNVTAAYGVNGFTEELLAAFVQHGLRKVWIAFDRDAAGDVAAERVAAQLNAHGIETFRVRFPKGMDANEYALKVGPAPKSLGLALRHAEWMGKGQRPAVESEDAIDVAPAETDAAADVAPDTASSLAADLPDAPAVAVVEVAAEGSAHEVNLTFADRHYRVRGLAKNLSYEVLKLNVLVRRGAAFHVDTLDLYSAKQRAGYVQQAAHELGLSDAVLKADLGAVLLQCEELQDQLIRGVLTKQNAAPTMSDAEVKAALAWLKSPHLMQQVLADFARCGVVGEEANKQVAYLAAVSRLLDKPLAVLVQSSSAAGKSSLMEAVLRFMPEEQRLQYSAMTGQSLFYLGEKDLRHKILAISEEEGASQASYALKLLQSEGVVSIASTGKNATTGNLETQEYRVEGPVMLFSTTTAIDLDEELLNRCLVLSVDESREQTQAIHAAQRTRRTLAGLRSGEDKQRLVTLHQNAQRLLRPLPVVNPYADQLTFLSDKTRMRRDHEKYLTLIDAIAVLHQYQREVKRETYQGAVIEYVEVSVADIALANELAHAVLGRTLDELPPQTRKVLQSIAEHVGAECAREQCSQADYRFSRKSVRQWSGWTDFQVKKHMQRLEELEYVLIHRGKRGQSFEYELLYQGEGGEGEAFVMGLVDVATLNACRYDEKKEPPATNKEPPNSPQVAAKVPGGSEREIPGSASIDAADSDHAGDPAKTARPAHNGAGSHRNHRGASSLAAAVEG